MEHKRGRSGNSRCAMLAPDDRTILCRPYLKTPDKKCTGKQKKTTQETKTNNHSNWRSKFTKKPKQIKTLSLSPLSNTILKDFVPTQKKHLSNKEYVGKKHENKQGFVQNWIRGQSIQKQASADTAHSSVPCWNQTNPQHPSAAVTSAVPASAAHQPDKAAKINAAAIPWDYCNQRVNPLLQDCTIQQCAFMNCKSLHAIMLQRP